MKKVLGVLGAFACAAFLVAAAPMAPAQASTYNFSYIGSLGDTVMGGFSASGMNITAISGNVTGSLTSGLTGGPITGLVTGSSPFYPNGVTGWTFSNTTDGHIFTGDGVLFAFDTGNYGNIYNSGGQTFLSLYNPAGLWNPGEAGTLSISATPLPSSLILFISALGGLGFLFAWRRKKNGAAFAATPA